MPLSLRCEIDQMFNPGKTLHEVDPELWAAVQQENQRQEDHIELIASENYASPAVLAAQGSQLTNKYAEGYPGKRYYGGCEFVDIAEQLAIDRVRKLFRADVHHYAANVQSSSGSQANQAVFFAAMKPGDTFLGMSLASVRPLPPRSPVNMSGRWFILMKAEHEKAVNSAVFPGLQGGPLMHVIAAKAVAFKEALEPEFKAYQKQVIANARKMAETFASRGLRIVSGRTESHMLLLDLRARNITGKDAEDTLGKAHITVNKNAIPNDPQKPFVTSGIRIGSPAMTTRGFRLAEAEHLGNLIADVLEAPQDEKTLKRVAAEVSGLCRRHPVYRLGEPAGAQRVVAG